MTLWYTHSFSDIHSLYSDIHRFHELKSTQSSVRKLCCSGGVFGWSGRIPNRILQSTTAFGHLLVISCRANKHHKCVFVCTFWTKLMKLRFLNGRFWYTLIFEHFWDSFPISCRVTKQLWNRNMIISINFKNNILTILRGMHSENSWFTEIFAVRIRYNR